MTLGDKIRKYRTLKGLTQAQLGSMVKLTGDRIRQYENNVRKPKDGKLFEIADALDKILQHSLSRILMIL